MRRAVRITRHAISPLFAMRIFLNMRVATSIAVHEEANVEHQHEQHDDERNRAKPLLRTDHSAASSIGGRLWPSRRSTSSAASARLVPGPKIACTPAARSAA